MALPIDDLLYSPTQAEVFAAILSVAQSVGLQTTSWAEGGVARTILYVVSWVIAQLLAIVGISNHGPFLDLASKVTADGGPGWLDELASRRYGCPRIAANYAPVTVTFTTGAACPGATFLAGELHVARGVIGYTNTATIAIPAGVGSVSGPFAADVAGATGSSGIGTIVTVVTGIADTTCTNALAALGYDAERNDRLVLRCRAKMAQMTTNGPAEAYIFNAKTINSENQVKVTSGPLTQPALPVTRARSIASVSTGVVTTYVANDLGPYASPPNYVNNVGRSIASSTNASPIVITTSLVHGYATGATLQISGHLVNTSANGNWAIVVLSATTFSLTSSVGVGVGVATGSAYRYSDLDLIDKSIQANCVPLATTAVTASAIGLNVALVGAITVTGAASNLTDAEIGSLATNAATAEARATDIGGDGAALTVYRQQFETAAINAINATAKGCKKIVLSSPSADLAIAANEVLAISPAPVWTVVRV